MPIDLPTTFGKAEYNVVLSLQRLAEGFNTLEARVNARQDPGGTAEALRQLRADLRRLTERVDALSRAVEILQQAP